MANFIQKKDWFGLADGTTLVASTSDQGYSEQLVEPTCSDGSIISAAVLAYGRALAPSNTYVQKAAI